MLSYSYYKQRLLTYKDGCNIPLIKEDIMQLSDQFIAKAAAASCKGGAVGFKGRKGWGVKLLDTKGNEEILKAGKASFCLSEGKSKPYFTRQLPVYGPNEPEVK